MASLSLYSKFTPQKKREERSRKGNEWKEGGRGRREEGRERTRE